MTARQASYSLIDFAAIADPKNEDNEPIVLDRANQPEVSNAVFPQFARLRAMQSLSKAAWILKRGQVYEESPHPLRDLRGELIDFLDRCWS
jgi:hypothetical protein